MKGNAWKFFRNYYSFTPRFWIFLVIGSLLQAAAVLSILVMIHRMINHSIPDKEINELVALLIAVFGATAFITLMTVILQNDALKGINQCSTAFREMLANAGFRFSKGFMHRTPVSKIQNSFVQDTIRIDEGTLAFLNEMLPSIIATGAINLILLILDWKLYLVLISTVPCLLAVSWVMEKKLTRSIGRHQRSVETFSDTVFHFLQILDLVHIQSAVDAEMSEHKIKSEDLQQSFDDKNRLKMIYLSVQNFLVTYSALLILGVGGYGVMTETLSVGTLLCFYIGVGIQKRYLISITSSLDKILAGRESLNNLFSIINGADFHPYHGRRIIAFDGSVRLENVSYGFQGSSLISHLSLELKPGNVSTVIGPNGSGKSTLVNLILGFYRPDEGMLYAGGIPYEEVCLEHLRKDIGVVSQTPLLRKGSVLENLMFGTPDIGFEDVREAVMLADARFIEALPEGYHTDIGPFGAKLSGGEKQKLAIARALLRRPKLLILDEPTNHLDREAVRSILETIFKLSYSPALLLISHDAQIIERSSEIIDFRRKHAHATG